MQDWSSDFKACRNFDLCLLHFLLLSACERLGAVHELCLEKTLLVQALLVSAESGDEEHYEDGVTSVSSTNLTSVCFGICLHAAYICILH